MRARSIARTNVTTKNQKSFFLLSPIRSKAVANVRRSRRTTRVLESAFPHDWRSCVKTQRKGVWFSALLMLSAGTLGLAVTPAAAQDASVSKADAARFLQQATF